jgi:hypothetical protein
LCIAFHRIGVESFLKLIEALKIQCERNRSHLGINDRTIALDDVFHLRDLEVELVRDSAYGFSTQTSFKNRFFTINQTHDIVAAVAHCAAP